MLVGEPAWRHVQSIDRAAPDRGQSGVEMLRFSGHVPLDRYLQTSHRRLDGLHRDRIGLPE
jgi:hypothetical protein